MSYSHSGNTEREIPEIDSLSYSVDVLGGVKYQFSVRAATIKPGPDALLTVDIPEYSKFSFYIYHIMRIQLTLPRARKILKIQFGKVTLKGALSRYLATL